MAVNLHGAVPNVRNTSQPPCCRLPGNCSVYRMSGVSRQAGGEPESGVPRRFSDWAQGYFCRKQLSQKTEICLCLESSLNRNMLNSFLFYQLTASQPIKLILFKLSHTRRDKYP